MSIAELEAAALEREHDQRMLTICLTMTAGHVDGYGCSFSARSCRS
jgi:hypothetical protein